ncbi:MAG: hypothetical protein JST22_03330 [Bacteroidetes bacterium]|nr:hypothetical protein [Bacteroidota bacterium]
MNRYYLLALVLAMLFVAPIAAHTQTEDEDADSLIEHSPWLLDDSLLTRPIPQATMNESRRLRTLRPGDWEPEFPMPFRRTSLLGLEDTPPRFLSYDRADGLYLGLGANSPARLMFERRTQGFFGFGYALGSHYWQVMGGLARDFGQRDAPLRIGGEGHIITDTRDAWKMESEENTAFALIAGKDNRDYFQRSGFSVYAEKFLSPRFGLTVEYRLDNYHNSKREIGWSLFGPRQPFFEVPPVREGSMSSVIVELTLDQMSLRSWDQPQYGVEAQAEFGSIVNSFQSYVIDARLKTTVIGQRLWLAVHARAGSVTGDAPPQRIFTTGGLGTLPGFPQNIYAGNRLMLVQTDLLFAPFPKLGLRVIVSNDFAGVSMAASDAGLLAGFPSSISDIKYSPGIYLGSATGAFRIGYAFRTDVFEDPRLVIRVSRPF